jgi:acyl carrier protein
MAESEDVLATILQCIEIINKQLPDGEKLALNPSTVLIGDQGRLDSLGLVMLISDIEQEIANKFSIHCALLDEVVADDTVDEDWTVGRLHQFIIASSTKSGAAAN